MDIQILLQQIPIFGHRNIVRYSRRPEDHDEIMVEAWNRTVGPDDCILHLGDLVWWGETLPDFGDIASRLNGQKFLIKGNHDRWSDQQYLDWGFKVVEPYRCAYGRDWVVRFDHYPSLDLQGDEILLHGHCHQNYSVHQGPQSINVGVDLFWGAPVPFEWAVNKVINRLEWMAKGNVP